MRTYNDPIIYITENGFSDESYDYTDDKARESYYKSYMNEVLKGKISSSKSGKETSSMLEPH